MIIINYKAYEKAIGENAVQITDKIEEIAYKRDEKIIVAPQTVDLNRIEAENIKLFSQHVDPVKTGSHTGSNQIKALKNASVSGTLINHSEKRLQKSEIKKIVEICKKNNISSVVCAQTPVECKEYSEFKPDYIAFEPPELIGGEVSVSNAEPEVIEEAVENSGETPTLTGAGIKTREDVEKSIEHGCKGVLVASGVVKSENIKQEVKELCKGL